MPARLARVPGLRRLALSALWLARGVDITIGHPWANRAPVRLNLFRHKGFWFHGRRREAATMAAFARLVRPGDTVFDVGAHIGWISLQFAHLVGPRGHVVAFEPGANNLPYLLRNLGKHPQAWVVEAAAGAAPGEADLFEESLTGQNNALEAPYHRLAANAALNPADAAVLPRRVRVTTLDAVAAETGSSPALVKIDVEGFELPVLHGAQKLLAEARPVLMLEITRDADAIGTLLADAGYTLFQVTPAGIRPADPEQLAFNVFAWPAGRDPAPLLAEGDGGQPLR
jgi:FkbM family methyltransferase